MTDILSCVVKGIAQVSGAALFHVRVTVFELSGLVSGWRHPGISQQLVRGVKPREIAHLCQDHGSHTEAQPGDGGNWRIQFAQNALNLFLNFSDLGVQFPDKADGVL